MSRRNASDTQALVGVGASFAATIVFGLIISCLLSASSGIPGSDLLHASAPAAGMEQHLAADLAWNTPALETAAHREVDRWQ
ncbi:MAG: hypothetical protein KF777_16695 [Planctomycetaceae bacterium]|nr:hypothetical protein [Planctomycetaceae bacterium]